MHAIARNGIKIKKKIQEKWEERERERGSTSVRNVNANVNVGICQRDKIEYIHIECVCEYVFVVSRMKSAALFY